MSLAQLGGALTEGEGNSKWFSSSKCNSLLKSQYVEPPPLGRYGWFSWLWIPELPEPELKESSIEPTYTLFLIYV
jgi:hypothetical protein